MRSTFSNWYEREMRANSEISRETDEIEQLLEEISTIAMVGISRSTTKDSYYIGRYLQRHGYRILPVNPKADQILGNKTYDNLHEIPEPIDVVDLIVPPKIIPKIVEQALQLEPLPRTIWLQLGTGEHEEVRQKVEQHDVRFVQNRCMKVDHQFLIRPKQSRRSSIQNY